MKIKIMLPMLAIGVSALGVGCACHRPPPPDGQAGGSGMRGYRPQSLLMMALDANHDGVIDAEEISNAPAALRTLDKNGDGQLTPDELRPPHPPQMNGNPEFKPSPLPPG
jgi:hypothetical protein